MATEIHRWAARNNAEWCDAVCRTHGLEGRFGPDAWSSPVRTPPLYPDAVTLEPEANVEELLADIDTRVGCSVKDSFADLDLAVAGFRELFHAEWLLLASVTVAEPGWATLTTAGGLHAWEAAWGEARDIFRPALLANPDVRLLARHESGRIVAGAVANRSAAVAGLGNVFDAGGELERAWRGAAGAAAHLWGLPLVAYDSGSSLDAARHAGFETVGELVVWVA